MPINSGYSNNDSLLREISKLNLSGSGTGFKYVKSANCELIANQESVILEPDFGGIREILLIRNTPEAIIELFWDDGLNKVQIPDNLNNENNRYIDNSDGGLTLSVKSNINANLDVYVRSTKLINYKIGNTIEIPEIEEDWFIVGAKEIEVLRIPIKPVFLDFPNWDFSYPIKELPISVENGYEYNNARIVIDITDSLPLIWTFEVKKYLFYVDDPYEAVDLWIYDVSQDAEKWTIQLGY